MPNARQIIDSLEIADFRAQFADDLVHMWRESFEEAVGIQDPHTLEQQTHYLLTEVVANNVVRVALLDGQIVGFVAASTESVCQLYIRRGFQRMGLGTCFIAWAKAQSKGRLWLYTFARNRGACAFYERHGFKVIARGFEEECQLEDVKYEWVAE